MKLSPSRQDRLITTACRILSQIGHRLPGPRWPLPARPRLLILKPCCLGDVLMATPALAALRARWPAAEIDFAVGPWSRPMLEHNPHLNRLIDCGPVGSGAYGLGDWLRLVERLRAGAYDACLVLDRSPLLSLVPALAGVPHRVGLDSDGRGFSLTRRVPLAGVAHEVDLYLACARALGAPTPAPRLQFFPSPEARARVAGHLRKARGPLAVVHPAGGNNPGMRLSAKRWPAERYAEIVRRLAGRGAQVAVVGGPDDVHLARRVCEGAGAGERVWNLAGALSFDELGALLEGAALFLGNDTGAMHLAVAVGAPTVAIFGPSDPRQYGPYGEGHRALWNPPACAPCMLRGRWNTACEDFRCIRAVEVEEVWEAISNLLP